LRLSGRPCPFVSHTAEKYTYNLVKLDNPHEKPGDAAETDATGYTFVTVGENKDLDLPSGGTTLGPTDNTFYLTDLIDGLYRVRIRSHNPNGADALSAWSDVIGTGEPERQRPLNL